MVTTHIGSLVALALSLLPLLAVAVSQVRLPRVIPAGIRALAKRLAPGVALSEYQHRILCWLSYCSDFRRGKRGDTLVVNAVAGSGKTFTLTAICTALRELRTQAGRFHSIVFCAFNKHIAQELRERLPKGVHVYTINGLGHRLLGTMLGREIDVDTAKYTRIARRLVEEHAPLLGLVEPLDPADAMVEDVVRAYTRNCRAWAYTVKALVDKARVGLVRLDLLAPERAAEHVYQLLRRYAIEVPEVAESLPARSNPAAVLGALGELCRRVLLEGEKQARNERMIDFADQLWLPHVLGLRASYGYMWLLVDECQDLSPAQLDVVSRYRWMDGTLNKSNTIFVGDRNQAIYAFAGASCDSVDRIITSTGADELPLSVCYRCPTSHIDLAQEIVPAIEAAPGAIEGSVEACEADEWLRDCTPVPGDLVICRTTAPLVTQLFRLWALGIRARVRGKAIGASLIELAERFGVDLVDELLPLVRDWCARRCQQLEADGHGEDSDAVQTVVDQVEALEGLAGNLSRDDGQPIQTVEELCAGIRRVCLDDEDGEPTVWLSTIHRAKGLEANCVHVLNADRIALRSNSEEQAAQEENLVYIAYTRAKERLVLVESPPRR